MDQSFQSEVANFFTRNGFEIKLLKTEEFIEIEAEEQTTSRIFSRKITQEILSKLDKTKIYLTLNDFFSALLHGFIGGLNLASSIQPDAKIILLSKLKVGNSERDYAITIDLEDENLETPDKCLRLIDRLEEQKTQPLEFHQTNYLKILRQILHHQKEQDKRSKSSPEQSVQVIGGENDNRELKEQMNKLESKMIHVVTNQEKEAEETKLKMELMESEFKQIKQRLENIEKENKLLEGKVSNLMIQINSFEATLQAIFERTNLVGNNPQIEIEKINKDIDSIKGLAKTITEIVSKNASKTDKQLEDLSKSLKNLEENYTKLQNNQTDYNTKLKLFEVETLKISQTKTDIEKNKVENIPEKDLLKINELSQEIVRMNERIESLKNADLQIEVVVQNLREQIKKDDLHNRVKNLEKESKNQEGNQKEDKPVESSNMYQISPQFDPAIEDALTNLTNDHKTIETKEGSILGKTFFAKSPLPDAGRFYFSFSPIKINLRQMGVFALGIAGASHKQNQDAFDLILPGCYFINPYHKLVYINGNLIEYVSHDFKEDDIITIVVDFDKAVIYFKINEIYVAEGAIELDSLNEAIYACVFTQYCSDLQLSFL